MNQNPEQLARDEIDRQFIASGWAIQKKKQINLAAAQGVAFREYQTNIGPVDCILFVNQKSVGLIEVLYLKKLKTLTSLPSTKRKGCEDVTIVCKGDTKYNS